MRLPDWARNPTRLMRTITWFVLSIIVATLLTLAFVAVLSGLAALHTRDDTASRAAARITALTADKNQLEARQEDNANRIGVLETAVNALSAQLREANLRPVVAVPARTTTTTAPVPATTAVRARVATSTTTTATTAPKPPPATTTTTTARPTPTTTCLTADGLGVCRTGRASRSGARTVLNWAALRNCESRNDYTADTGNSHYGAYQFNLSTWRSVGGAGNPAHASPDEQDHRARLLYQRRGAQPWPYCGRYL